MEITLCGLGAKLVTSNIVVLMQVIMHRLTLEEFQQWYN